MKHYSSQEIKAIRRHLRPLLPKEAFASTPGDVAPMLFHWLVLLGSAAAIGRLPSVWQWALCAVVGGHSMAVVSFYAHHLSHGHFVRQRHVRRLLELAVWTVTLQPATVWRETHNHVHHRNTNTLRDAFRYYAEEERTTAHTLYSWLLIPNRANWFNMLIFVTPTFLHMLHAFTAVFAPRAKDRVLVTQLGEYTLADRVSIVLEVGLIVAFQVALFHLSGGSWERYLWSGLVTMTLASLLAGGYAYSQHSAHPLGEDDNPFATTTLKIPRFVSRIHAHVDHHTAHHLFEAVNVACLPQVTQLLREHYPDALDERGPIDCWRAIYQNELYKVGPSATMTAAVPE